MSQSKNSLHLRRLVFCALMCAFSIVLGKFLVINIGTQYRLSFENLPIILSGFYLGPIPGIAVGVCADLLGSLLRGFDINLLITLGALLIGLVSGIVGLFSKSKTFLMITLAEIAAHVVGSLLAKTVALFMAYTAKSGLTVAGFKEIFTEDGFQKFLTLFGGRCLNYLIVIPLELIVLFILTKNKYISSRLKGLS